MPRLSSPARLTQRTYNLLSRHRPALVALDTETTGVDWFDEPFCATLTWRDAGGRMWSGYVDLDDVYDRECLGKRLREIPTWVGHNLKFDLQKLILLGVLEYEDLRGRELHDTQAQAHLLWPNDPIGLKPLAVRVLNYDDTVEVEIKSGPNKGKTKRVPREEHELAKVRRKLGLKKEDGYHLLPREVLYPYAIKDTEFTLQLHERLHGRLEGRLLDVYAMEMKLLVALYRMESNGYGLDLEYLRETATGYGARVVQSLGRLRARTGDLEFNPGSWQQIKAAFDRLGVVLEGTDEAAMQGVMSLAPSSEAVGLAEEILEYRDAKKVYSTWLSALLNEQRDGVVHPSFRQFGTRSGRMSSGANTG